MISDLELHESLANSKFSAKTIEKEEEQKICSFSSKYIGLLYCLIFSISMTAENTAVKMVKTPAGEKLFARACVQFITLLPLITYNQYKGDYSIFMSERRIQLLLIGRGISSSAVSIFLFEGIQRIAIGDCIAITFCSTIFAGVFAKVFLKEPYTIFDVIVAVISMAGVVLIAQPEFIFGSSSEPNPEQISGVLYTLGAAITFGSSLTIVRALGKVEPSVGVFYYVVICWIISGIFFYAEGDSVIPCLSDLPLFFSIGLLGNSCQFLITKALQHERPSTVGVMRSIEIILTYIVQVVLFNNIPNIYSIIGALLIFTSTLGLTVRKCLKNVEMKEHNNSSSVETYNKAK